MQEILSNVVASTQVKTAPAVLTEYGVGLHYTAFRDAIREDSRQTIPSRGVTPRKKFAVEANVESRAMSFADARYCLHPFVETGQRIATFTRL